MRRGRYIGYAVSAAVVAVILFTFDWSEVGARLKDFDYRTLLPAVAIYLVSYLFRALRWQCMLEPLKRIRLSSSFVVVVIGFMANNILPLRIGEFVRAWAIRRKEGISASAGFATIVIERVYDGLTLVGLFAIILIFFEAERATKIWGLAAAAVFIVVLLLLLFAVFREPETKRILANLIRIVPRRFRAKLQSLTESFISGLHFLSSGRRQAIVIFYSFVVWGLEASVFWVIMKGFGFPLPAYAAVVTLVIVNIAIMIPAGPGYIGTFDAAAVAALAPFGVNKDAAISYIIIVHALQYLSVTIPGLVFVNASGWNLREIEEAEKL